MHYLLDTKEVMLRYFSSHWQNTSYYSTIIYNVVRAINTLVINCHITPAILVAVFICITIAVQILVDIYYKYSIKNYIVVFFQF